MLKGIAASGGFAIGKIWMMEEQKPRFQSNFKGVAVENERLETALEIYCAQTRETMDMLRRIIGKEQADIFNGHIFMAKDPDIQQQIKQKIAHGFTAEIAAESICDAYIARFLDSPAEFTRQRAADIRDVKETLLHILCKKKAKIPVIPAGSVLAARELKPSLVRLLDRRRTVAILSETGGRNSHLAILARAMGIPAVFAVQGLTQSLHNGQRVIVDAEKGEVIKIE